MIDDPYTVAVNMLHEAYRLDRTPSSWRMPASLLPTFMVARDAVGIPLAHYAGPDTMRMMGLPLEVFRDNPNVPAVLSLIATPPAGPEPKGFPYE